VPGRCPRSEPQHKTTHNIEGKEPDAQEGYASWGYPVAQVMPLLMFDLTQSLAGVALRTKHFILGVYEVLNTTAQGVCRI
jgi:hypothetical protein